MYLKRLFEGRKKLHKTFCWSTSKECENKKQTSFIFDFCLNYLCVSSTPYFALSSIIQLTTTYSKSTIEILQNEVKYVQS